MSRPAAIFLMGPTASGKTEIAVRLVQALPCEIVSVDSAMVYRGMDIGTAKPDQQILKIAPHHLIDIRDPSEPYSAAQFAEDALLIMQQIISRGNIPLLVGGTFLYYRALYEGLSPLPAADPTLRRQLEYDAETMGLEALHKRLMTVDPMAAQRIHPNDPQRIQRALEVFELTGKAMSQILKDEKPTEFCFDVTQLILAPSDRALLHEKIALRFNEMLSKGLVDEVRKLFNCSGLHKNLPSIRAVGYRQVWEYFEGELAYDLMIQKGIVATRQLAKRQFTWLRANKKGVWFDTLDNKLFSKVLKKLLNDPIVKTKL
ncbi:MAG: tRNA (adenosine(37)-N6)-dimethylallyltransferase MiaA [Gammaproteobacteria bacterium]|nr:tRNA (adenosine(37)-N6)-dimethylallyltransferase MiaA [Gammaproteobacteria bacterium]